MQRLAHRYTGDERRVEGMTRNEVCQRFQGKILLIARRLYERLSPQARVPLDDLAAVGAIGLLEAFDRFEPARGIRFTTYAEYRIRGAMYDTLRDNDSFSRRRRQLAKQVSRASGDLRSELGRDPSPEEVAERLGIDVEEYHDAVERTQPVSQVSLDAPATDNEEGPLLIEGLVERETFNPDRRLRAEQAREVLKASIEELPERQRQCVMMYYGTGLTLAEIAKVFDVTPPRVSQILSEARDKLKKKLRDRVELDDLEAPP